MHLWPFYNILRSYNLIANCIFRKSKNGYQLSKTVLYRKLGTTFLLLCTAVIFFPLTVFSQLKFKHLTINQGLSQNSVLCMWQDREGFVWIGTEDGLNRYDGYEFKHYKHDAHNKKSISSSFINSIIEDATGNLWIATADGLNIYNKRKDEFIRIATTSSKALKLNLNRDFINSLFLDNKNNR